MWIWPFLRVRNSKQILRWQRLRQTRLKLSTKMRSATQQEQSSCSLRSFFPGEATLLNLYGLNDHLEYHILLQVFFQKYHSWNYFWKFFSKSLRKSNDKTYDLLKQEKLPSEYSTSLPGAEISGQTSCRWVEVKKGCLSVELFLELEQRNSISFLGVR